MYICITCNQPVYSVDTEIQNKRGEYRCLQHPAGEECEGMWARDPYIPEMLEFELRPEKVRRIEQIEEKHRGREVQERKKREIEAAQHRIQSMKLSAEELEQNRRKAAQEINRKVDLAEMEHIAHIQKRIARSKGFPSSSRGG